jgi:hypothetical protein
VGRSPAPGGGSKLEILELNSAPQALTIVMPDTAVRGALNSRAKFRCIGHTTKRVRIPRRRVKIYPQTTSPSPEERGEKDEPASVGRVAWAESIAKLTLENSTAHLEYSAMLSSRMLSIYAAEGGPASVRRAEFRDHALRYTVTVGA